MTSSRDDRIGLFRNLQSPATQPQFWARVADDVDWTVEGTHALAGRYHDKQEFIDATFGRLDGVLQGGVKLEVEHLYVDGDTTIAELLSTSATNEGASFVSRRPIAAGWGRCRAVRLLHFAAALSRPSLTLKCQPSAHCH